MCKLHNLKKKNAKTQKRRKVTLVCDIYFGKALTMLGTMVESILVSKDFPRCATDKTCKSM